MVLSILENCWLTWLKRYFLFLKISADNKLLLVKEKGKTIQQRNITKFLLHFLIRVFWNLNYFILSPSNTVRLLCSSNLPEITNCDFGLGLAGDGRDPGLLARDGRCASVLGKERGTSLLSWSSSLLKSADSMRRGRAPPASCGWRSVMPGANWIKKGKNVRKKCGFL